jgi:hypothetical protein
MDIKNEYLEAVDWINLGRNRAQNCAITNKVVNLRFNKKWRGGISLPPERLLFSEERPFSVS